MNDILSVATFETTRDLDVVDFTAKPDLFAVFQQSKDDLITAIQRYVFLSEVSKDMSKAVRRYDNKEIDMRVHSSCYCCQGPCIPKCSVSGRKEYCIV